jgi:ADYC domain
MFLRISALAVVLGAGCVDGELAPPQTGAAQQAVIDCDEFMCGTNSPQIATFGFWDLNLPTVLGTPGLPNNVGIQLLDFVQGGVRYLPTVSRGRLLATRGAITLSGSGLVGGALELVNHGQQFLLKITEVGLVTSWAQPATTTRARVMLESYKLDWTELVNGQAGEFRNMCTNPPNVEDPTSGMTGSAAYHTLLFEGDRIEAAKKLDTGIDSSWFNLGCAGSTLAKMALTGHTEAAHNARTFDTTLAERQAMLKMLAADYCGDGTPFTVSGQPLNWADDHGTMKLLSPPQSLVLEARWTEHGAACLDKPRVDVHPTPLSTAVFGANVDIYNLVQSRCPLQMPRQCDDSSLDVAGYHLVSATPL